MKSLLAAICTVIALSCPAFAQDDGGGDGQDGGASDPASAQTTTDNSPDAVSPPQDPEPEDPEPEVPEPEVPVSEDVLKQYEAVCTAKDGSIECAEIAEQVCESNTADLTACKRAAGIAKGNPKDIIMVRPKIFM